jgi:hypothetical protein
MKDFVAIIKNTSGVVDKYQDFDVEADAVSHVEQYGGFVVADPGGQTNYWIVNEAANTVVNDQDQADADTLARSWDILRADRNTKLTDSDWTHYTDSPLGDEVKADWASYRQELRDLPTTTDDPDEPTWPETPE